MRHIALEGIKRIKINTLSGLGYMKFNLDNGEAHKKVKKTYKNA